MVYKCAWYCWVVCVFENSPGWNSSVSSLRGFHQFVMSSLRWIPILFRFALKTWQGALGSPHARIANWGEHLQLHRVFVQAPLLHHVFFSIPYFFEIHLRRFPIIYFCNCFFCSNDWNKISKFEREFLSNGKSRLHQGFFSGSLISSPSKQ